MHGVRCFASSRREASGWANGADMCPDVLYKSSAVREGNIRPAPQPEGLDRS